MKKNLLRNMTVAIASLFITIFSLPQAAQAADKEAYVAENGSTLTFYYDEAKDTRTGTVYDIDQKQTDDPEVPAWAGTGTDDKDNITKVVFDSSFNDYMPTDMTYWFSHFTKLQTIEGMDNLNTNQVTGMPFMFYGCSALTSLNLSSFDTSAVTDMSGMFSQCKSLASLNLSSFNTSKVTSMNTMFSGCSALTLLNLASFDTSALTDMSYMFNGCLALTALNLTNFDITKEKEAYMTYMFADCPNLTTIYCNNNWSCDDSGKMFFGCPNLVGAVAYDAAKTNASMANPTTGYFTKTGPGRLHR